MHQLRQQAPPSDDADQLRPLPVQPETVIPLFEEVLECSFTQMQSPIRDSIATPLTTTPPDESSEVSASEDNMLEIIRRGVTLRRTISNDRSAPRIGDWSPAFGWFWTGDELLEVLDTFWAVNNTGLLNWSFSFDQFCSSVRFVQLVLFLWSFRFDWFCSIGYLVSTDLCSSSDHLALDSFVWFFDWFCSFRLKMLTVLSSLDYIVGFVCLLNCLWW